ncbi:MAG: hypothetical protein FJZ63_04105 [Chlamydiae bacterium]|nr:hypothetical protein [Chlamydiota bacterium]
MSLDVSMNTLENPLLYNAINTLEEVKESSQNPKEEPLDPQVVHKLFNFIVNTYRISTLLEDKANEYVKSAKQHEKGIEENWKVKNRKKVNEMKEKAALFRQAAVISSGLLALQIVAGVAGTSMSLLPGSNESIAEFGRLLSQNGSSIAQTGREIAGNLTNNQSELCQASIDTLIQQIQSLWEADRTDAQARKTELDQLLEKLRNSTQSALDKTSTAYSYR